MHLIDWMTIDSIILLNINIQNSNNVTLTVLIMKVKIFQNYSSMHSWFSQDIVLVVLPTDILEIDVRDKFNVRYFRVSHFLGRAKVPLNQFVRSGSVQ